MDKWLSWFDKAEQDIKQHKENSKRLKEIMESAGKLWNLAGNCLGKIAVVDLKERCKRIRR